MCVIIDKKAGFEIPRDKLISARHVNPHGFGIVVPNDGRLVTRKILNPTDDEIVKIVNEFKEFPAKIHFRYKTQGDINADNLHPFQILNYDDHGIDIIMMHNGTLHEFNPAKDDKRSDSRIFAEDFCRPLFERMEAIGYENLLSDPFVERILKKYIPSASKVLFTDSEDKTLIINKNQGNEFDFGWSSNKYSFERDHREKKTYTYKKPGIWAGSTNMNAGGTKTPTATSSPAGAAKPKTRVPAETRQFPVSSPKTSLSDEKKGATTPTGSSTSSTTSQSTFEESLALDNVLRLEDISDIKDIKEIGYLSLSDLEFMMKQHTSLMAAAMRELYYKAFGELRS